MKTVCISFIFAILFVLAISIDAQAQGKSDCPSFCTFDYKPVCGYNGDCYRKFGNACTLKVERCNNKSKNDIRAVQMELCEEALAKSNPKVVACKDGQ